MSFASRSAVRTWGEKHIPAEQRVSPLNFTHWAAQDDDLTDEEDTCFERRAFVISNVDEVRNSETSKPDMHSGYADQEPMFFLKGLAEWWPWLVCCPGDELCFWRLYF